MGTTRDMASTSRSWRLVLLSDRSDKGVFVPFHAAPSLFRAGRRGAGQVVDLGRLGMERVLTRSRELLGSARPIFEAGFSSGGAVAFADVMLPVVPDGSLAWRMAEV